MSWTLITKATRPDTDTDFYTGQSQSDFDYIKETYKDTGKIVSITQALSDNELERDDFWIKSKINVLIFKFNSLFTIILA